MACRKLARPAKKKALLCLREKSFDEENVISPPPHPEAAQQSKATRSVVRKTQMATCV